MKIDFKKYDSDKPIYSMLNHPEIGDICLCECDEFCPEGCITAQYTVSGFEFFGHGNIDKYVTGYVVLDL